jgi:hypothetical protein
MWGPAHDSGGKQRGEAKSEQCHAGGKGQLDNASGVEAEVGLLVQDREAKSEQCRAGVKGRLDSASGIEAEAGLLVPDR